MRWRAAIVGAVALAGGTLGVPAVPNVEAIRQESSSAGTRGVAEALIEPEGTLRIADFGDVLTFDPAHSQATQAGYLYPVYDTLVRQDSSQELVPHLATGWSQPDPTSLRFTLRDDVVFHDGSRFDADTVKANLERAKADPGNPNGPTFAAMTEVIVVDSTTVEVRFSEPAPTFLLEMSMVQGMMVSSAALESGVDLTRDPHGSGPWTWSRDASQEGVREVYELTSDYWAPELQGVERIEISVVPDNLARFAALQTGQVDIVYSGTGNQIDDAGAAGLDVYALDLEAHWLMITDRDGVLAPPLADDRVRQAIAHAIDRGGYVAAVYEGVGSASGGLVPPAVTNWYDPALVDVPTFDPKLSRQLLADAGYPDGFEMDMPTMPVMQSNVEAIAQMLGAVGIDLNLVPLQNGQLGGEMRRGGFPMALGIAAMFHPHEILARFASGSSPLNPFHVDDTSAIDDGLSRAAEAEPDEAKAIYSEVVREVIETGIMLPVSFEPVVNFAGPHVTGVFIPLGVRSAYPYGVRVDGS
jgi:peptide/nickel transport system substrate-binding protein